jgi:lactoylglutathione lyase
MIMSSQPNDAPPMINLVVIRCADIEIAARFYSSLGLFFAKEKHGEGPEHYAACVDGFVFEIYPLKEGDPPTTGLRLGFEIDAVDAYIPDVQKMGGTLVKSPYDSRLGRRAVIKDPDGHTIELVCKMPTAM